MLNAKENLDPLSENEKMEGVFQYPIDVSPNTKISQEVCGPDLLINPFG